jgi:hypothetical protein
MDRITSLVFGVILLFPGACAIYFMFKDRPPLIGISFSEYGLIPGAIWLGSFTISFIGLLMIAKALEK